MSDKKKVVKSVIFGVLCGLLSTIILMCILSVVMLTGGLLPSDIIKFAMVGILSVGAFFGGLIATKINKSAGLVVGIITGFVMFLIITATALTKNSEPVSYMTLIKLGAALLAGGAGGILGLRERKRIRIWHINDKANQIIFILFLILFLKSW